MLCRRGYARHPYTRKCAIFGCFGVSGWRALSSISKGVAQSSCLQGVRLDRYPAVLNASGQRSSGNLASIRIARALLINVAPDRSADPFCAGVYGAVVSTAIPSYAIQVSKAFPNEVSSSERNICISRLY
jgi:hypothetical protein